MKGAQRREEQQFTEVVLHIMRQCVIQMPVVLGLEKNSPLQPNVNKYLRRLIEGGKWPSLVENLNIFCLVLRTKLIPITSLSLSISPHHCL